ncbi:hypothetical protein F5879DRAFT_532381 [Lentinula edodes]|nr:hypothetical protein F5879DRAFT_532381 [Lentinula edodes]
MYHQWTAISCSTLLAISAVIRHCFLHFLRSKHAFFIRITVMVHLSSSQLCRAFLWLSIVVGTIAAPVTNVTALRERPARGHVKNLTLGIRRTLPGIHVPEYVVRQNQKPVATEIWRLYFGNDGLWAQTVEKEGEEGHWIGQEAQRNGPNDRVTKIGHIDFDSHNLKKDVLHRFIGFKAVSNLEFIKHVLDTIGTMHGVNVRSDWEKWNGQIMIKRIGHEFSPGLDMPKEKEITAPQTAKEVQTPVHLLEVWQIFFGENKGFWAQDHPNGKWLGEVAPGICRDAIVIGTVASKSVESWDKVLKKLVGMEASSNLDFIDNVLGDLDTDEQKEKGVTVKLNGKWNGLRQEMIQQGGSAGIPFFSSLSHPFALTTMQESSIVHSPSPEPN